MDLPPINPILLLNALLIGGLLAGVWLWNQLRASNSALERANLELRGEGGTIPGPTRQSGQEYLQPWLVPGLLAALLMLGICVQFAFLRPSSVAAVNRTPGPPSEAATLAPLVIEEVPALAPDVSVPDRVFPPQLAWTTGDCSQLTLHHAREIAQRTALIEGVSSALILAVIYRESSFRPCAVSSAGAQGLMQLKPGTALDVGVTDPFDPVDNISGGARYLRFLLDRYEGDVATALRAYLNGPGTVERLGARGYASVTNEYVASVMDIAEALADD